MYLQGRGGVTLIDSIVTAATAVSQWSNSSEIPLKYSRWSGRSIVSFPDLSSSVYIASTESDPCWGWFGSGTKSVVVQNRVHLGE